jgi:hypothetical protein
LIFWTRCDYRGSKSRIEQTTIRGRLLGWWFDNTPTPHNSGASKADSDNLSTKCSGPLVTEFALNLGREGATPIQPGFNAGLLGRI